MRFLYLIMFIQIIYLQNFDYRQIFPQVISEDIVLDNAFLGGANYPVIRWADWDDDNDIDLFILDEDGRIKYFKNNGCSSGECDFQIETTCFQNITNIGCIVSHFDRTVTV